MQVSVSPTAGALALWLEEGLLAGVGFDHASGAAEVSRCSPCRWTWELVGAQGLPAEWGRESPRGRRQHKTLWNECFTEKQ